MKNSVTNKEIYRCDEISAIKGFLPVRDILRLEMFGDIEGGERNFDGVLSDLETLYDNFNKQTLLKVYSKELLVESDIETKNKFVDEIINVLINKCGIPEKYFNYGIWGCDNKNDVAISYDVEPEYINKYFITGFVLQDLDKEGQLYGVAEYPILVEEDLNTLFESVYNECTMAGGSGGIASFAPEHSLSVKTFGPNYFARSIDTDYGFVNDTMKVHKKKDGQKGDALSGTGIIYANGKELKSPNNRKNYFTRLE